MVCFLCALSTTAEIEHRLSTRMSGCGRESEEFSLSLGSEEPLVSKPGASAFCKVTSASLQFDTAIREKIRFAVTRRVGLDHVKQKVANR